MTTYNPRGFFSTRDMRSCLIFVVSAVVVFWLGVIVGVVIGRMLG